MLSPAKVDTEGGILALLGVLGDRGEAVMLMVPEHVPRPLVDPGTASDDDGGGVMIIVRPCFFTFAFSVIVAWSNCVFSGSPDSRVWSLTLSVDGIPGGRP
jgi:hypothetical protein